MNPAFGVVAIGRNEGERLRQCLVSVAGIAKVVVYVDSASSDGSVELAEGIGAEIVRLDMSLPFSAARARNEGFARLRELAPHLPYVQFVDGDCEMVSGWSDRALAWLDAHPDVAMVCGRRRERYPRRSVYNRLCDIEWDTAQGEAKACGGDAMVRVEAFVQAGGFRSDLIAGEEPELCIRLRAKGWRIWRLDGEMTVHDAAMLKFSQWWKRSMRFGHAVGEGFLLHGGPPERHWARESRSAWFWGLILPLAILAGALFVHPLTLLLLAAYPVQVMRLALKGRRSVYENWLLASFLVLAKFPEMLGQAKFRLRRLFGQRGRLIEYK